MKAESIRRTATLLMWVAIAGAKVWPGSVIAQEIVTLSPETKRPIGTSVLRLTDTSRRNRPGDDTARELVVQFWYPASRDSTKPFSRYLFEPGLLEAMKAEGYLNIPTATLEAWGQSRTHAREDAPIAHAGRLPLLVFSHGFGVARANYTSISEDLASHGYVVAVLDHPYLGLTIGGDGQMLSSSLLDQDEALAPARVAAAADDAILVIDRLLNGEGDLDAFAEAIDPERIGMLGHSLGGAAALETCLRDKRFKACANLDGYPFGRISQEGVGRPFLLLLSKPTPADQPLGKLGLERRETWLNIVRRRSQPVHIVTISETMHLSFSDLPQVVPAALLRKHGGTIPASRLHKIMLRSIRAFFGKYLAGKAEEDLQEVEKAYKEVAWEVHGE